MCRPPPQVWYRGDPGYNATARMLAEAGRCLALPGCHAPAADADAPPGGGGGVLTASVAMGLGLLRRLERVDGGAFMGFRVVE